MSEKQHVVDDGRDGSTITFSREACEAAKRRLARGA
jgi:hypothetical protein